MCFAVSSVLPGFTHVIDLTIANTISVWLYDSPLIWCSLLYYLKHDIQSRSDTE